MQLPPDRRATVFRTDAELPATHGWSCGCSLHRRRLFTGALVAGAAGAVLPARGREGVEVDGQSPLARLVPAEQIEQAAEQQYRQMLQQAARQRALAPESHPQVQRLRDIAKRLIPFSFEWNARARDWQ